MSHFAKIENNIVVQVIVAEQEFIDTLPDKHLYVQTSYNTHGNTHPNNTPLRKNYACIGSVYDKELDIFISPKVYPDSVLNTSTGLWEIDLPTDSGNVIAE